MLIAHRGGKLVYAFQHRQEIPTRKQRFIIDAYITQLRLELEYAQQTLDAIDQQPAPRKAKQS